MKPLLIIPLLLLNLTNASAISMSLGMDVWSNQVRSAGGAITDNLRPVSVISPLNGGITAAASTRSFTNMQDQAVLSGQQSLVDFGAVAGVSSYAKVTNEIQFLLNERVNYSFTGGLNAILGEGGVAHTFAWLEVMNPEMDWHWDDVYQESDRISGPLFGSTQLGDSARIGANTGILDPGGYYLTFTSLISDGGAGYGNYTFTMTPVPEGGATWMLLGIALGVIGIYKKATLIKL